MRGRQIIGPRRVVLFVLFIDDHSPAVDTALDLKAVSYGDYWDTLFDSSLLKFHAGERPSWFTIQPLSTAQKLAAPAAKDSRLARAAWFVRCGLTKIEDYPAVQPDGSELPHPQPDRKRAGALGELASEGWLQEGWLSERDILGLGAMIEHISEALHPLARRSSGAGTPGGAQSETEKPAT